MAELTLGEAATAMGGRLAQGDAAAAPSGYSIDSRTVAAGDLFFALKGPNHDGHRFVGAALEAGALGAVVSEEVSGSAGVALVRVGDTLRAMQELAAHVRRRERVKVVGITGSAGKTTAKEMTHAVLAGAFRAYRSGGNFNNLYGMPLMLLRMPPGTQVAILEMGMSTPGELRRLAEIAAPDVGVLLNVGRAHLEYFGSVEGIARAKAELFEGMDERSIGIFNEDDDLVRGIADTFGGFHFTFGIERPADLQAAEVTPEGLSGTRFVVRHGATEMPARIGFVGVHHVYNLLAAVSAGYMLGCDLEGMLRRGAGVSPLPGRGDHVTLPSGAQLIDDSYNSNPSALRRAIHALVSAAPPGGRRVLVTGDMLELGEPGADAHREAGRIAAEARLEVVIAVGPLSAGTTEAAREGGVGQVLHFDDSETAARPVAELVEAGDTVLVKGSRGMRMERIVQALRAAGGEDGTATNAPER